MMTRDTVNADFFSAGGILSLQSPAYIKRPTDDELFELAASGQFCGVFAPPQMGKSSLMLRTSRRLQDQGIKTMMIYLSGLGSSLSAEEWYLGLIFRLAFQLKLPVEPKAWWQEQTASDPARRFHQFLKEVILTQTEGQLVIFFDEIETIFRLSFPVHFFSALCDSSKERADEASAESSSKGLSFVLLGQVTRANLRADTPSLPDKMGVVELADFSLEEAQPLQQALASVQPEADPAVFERIIYWTGGQPYLTQRLCQAVAQTRPESWNTTSVDRLVEQLFLSPRAEDIHLQFIWGEINRSNRRRKLLALYRRLYQGRTVSPDEQSPEQNELFRLGLIRDAAGVLQIRNEIYRRAFSTAWLKTAIPIRSSSWLGVAATVLLVILLLTGIIGLAVYWQQQRARAAEAELLINNFRNTADSQVRLTNLAGLFNLPGYEEQAQQLFYQGLAPDEQLALFELVDPAAVGTELVTVVQGLYDSPDLEAGDQGILLLRQMDIALSALPEASFPAAVSLDLEIAQWLKGREYQALGEYQDALTAYGNAIEINERNPGVYFDQGLTYATLGEAGQALAYFELSIRLDEAWQSRIEETVIADAELYTTLWNEAEAHTTLAEFIPTPTPTPTATTASTDAPPPSPTPTSTPVPATPTPTPTSSPTQAPTPTPTTPVTVSPESVTASSPVRLAYVIADEAGHTLAMAELANFAVVETEAVVPNRAASPSWSPDGQQLAFVGETGIEHVLPEATGGSGVWIYDVGAQAPALLAEVGGLNYVAWSPDGRLIAYESTRDIGEARIFFMDMAGETRPVQIPGEQPAWSPDGQRLITKACRPECGLWTVDLEGGMPVQTSFRGTDSFPHWGAGQVVFSSEQNGNWDIYRVRVDEMGRPLSEPEPLTSDPAQDITPVFGPNEQQIYFRSSRDGQWAIWVMNADGTEPRRLIETGGTDAWKAERLAVIEGK